MADKSKNEQYDIVAQAQDVLDLYIKRCFDINHGKIRTFKKRAHINKGALLLSLLAGCCTFIAALIYFIL
ncbi:MAG: hypothetical protein E7410_03080 [Ruminococcaceae bacterium]|nr:hypothetical protein [Oscillospiraceae bacterium]